MLELSLREALALGHSYIGPEHILLGLARAFGGVSAGILLDFDLTAKAIRAEVLDALSGGQAATRGGVTTGEGAAGAGDPETTAEIERLRNEKQAAIEAGEFERAAGLRDEERRLSRQLKGEAYVVGERPPVVLGYDEVVEREPAPLSLLDSTSLAVGGGIALAAAALGLLAGRLIWR